MNEGNSTMTTIRMTAVSLTFATTLSVAQAPRPATAPAATPSEHVRQDITRHRAMAAAHEAAARCLEAGRSEDDCLKQLQTACKGLGIGKYCGMRHEH
jgi:hypothetical protein